MRKLIVYIFLLFVGAAYGQGPEAHWLFENTTADSVNSYDGIIRGTATYDTDPVKQGTYSMYFNGGRMITPPMNFGSGGLAISLWFYSAATSGYHDLLNNGVAGVGSRLEIFLDAANTRIMAKFNNGSSENSAATSTGVYTRGAWTHVLFNMMDVDGSYASLAVNNVNVTVDSAIQTGWLKNDTLCIGGNRGGGSLWDGYIDNTQIYLRALSVVERDSLYDNGTISFRLGGTSSGGGTPPEPPPETSDTSTLIKNFALDRHFILSGDAEDGDIVSELMIAQNWDTITSVAYFIHTDTSGLFSVSGDSLIIDDISGVQDSKWYAIMYKITDGDYYDSAYAYVYKPPADSCVVVTNWTTYDNNFTTGYYYFQARGTSITLPSSDIDFNVNDVYCGAMGNGVRPVIKKAFDNGGTAEEGFFTTTSRTAIWIQSIYFDINGYSNTNPWYSDGIFGAYTINLTVDNCIFYGKVGTDYAKYMSYPFRFYNPSGLNISFCRDMFTLHGNWVSNCNTARIVSNNSSDNDYIQDYYGDIGAGGADCWMFSNDVGGNDHQKLYFGYNYLDKSSHVNKSGIIFGGSTDGTNDQDTVEWNWYVGPTDYNETYMGTGIAMSGASYTVVRYNRIYNTGRGIFIFHETGTTWTNTNVQIYGNLLVNCYYAGIHFNLESDGSTVYNNTFVGYGDSTSLTGNSAIALHGDNIDVRNNIFYDANGEEPFYGRAYPVYYNLYYDKVSHALAAGEIEADPQMNSDYTLQSDSPAIDEGETLSIIGFPGVDLKNDIRPYNTLWDMGAYEWVLAETPIVTPTTIETKRRIIIITL